MNKKCFIRLLGWGLACFGAVVDLFAATLDGTYTKRAPDIHKYCVSIKDLPGTTVITGLGATGAEPGDSPGPGETPGSGVTVPDYCYVTGDMAYCNSGCIASATTKNGHTVPAGRFFVDTLKWGIGLNPAGVSGLSARTQPMMCNDTPIGYDALCHHTDGCSANAADYPVYLCGPVGNVNGSVPLTGDYEFCSCNISGGQICFYDPRFMVYFMGKTVGDASGYEAASVGLSTTQINNMTHKPVVYENQGCPTTMYQRTHIGVGNNVCNLNDFVNLCEDCPSAPAGGLDEMISGTVVGNVGRASCAISGTFQDDSGQYEYPGGCKYAE